MMDQAGVLLRELSLLLFSPLCVLNLRPDKPVV